MPNVPDVTEITVDREEMELRLAFADGTRGSIGLVDLRLACPCAGCRAARQAGREPWPARPVPAGEHGPVLAVADAELVGAWGLSVTWDDGHATGIYPFDALHSWVVTGSPSFAPDSGLGA
jgi:DUF971 family protein